MLEELILKAIQERQKEFTRKENEIFVTDITTCQVKKQQQTNEYILARGTFMHEGIQWLLQNYIKDRKIEIEKKIEKDYGDFILTGRIDLIIDDEVIELKTTSKPPQAPYIEHLYQLLIYMHLLGQKKGRLVYITPNEVIEYVISDGQIKNEKTGQILFMNIEINDEKIRELARLYKEGKLIAQFNQCSQCFLKNTCEWRK